MENDYLNGDVTPRIFEIFRINYMKYERKIVHISPYDFSLLYQYTHGA